MLQRVGDRPGDADLSHAKPPPLLYARISLPVMYVRDVAQEWQVKNGHLHAAVAFFIVSAPFFSLCGRLGKPVAPMEKVSSRGSRSKSICNCARQLIMKCADSTPK